MAVLRSHPEASCPVRDSNSKNKDRKRPTE
jgi:hypothetical protein